MVLLRPPTRIPWFAHALLGAWAATFLVLGSARPERYEALLQEDRFVEWLTVALFAGAAFFALRRAWRGRRIFDGLVGLFCFFVAGEEFSWGQRLFGIRPPDAFLEHNRQQELTVHNFADTFGEPKWLLIVALVGFGLALPLLARSARGARLLERAGASAPHVSLVPWILAAALLLVWYPYSFTGEWVETLAGGAFLFAFMPAARAGATALAAAVPFALGMSWLSGRMHESTPEQFACAQAEADALVQDIGYGAAATGRLIGASSVHKRLFTAIDEGYVRAERLSAFHAADCPGVPDGAERRRHALDPWGSAYWIDVDRSEESIRLIVYSFGPNRRRDGAMDRVGGDDLSARVDIVPLAAE